MLSLLLLILTVCVSAIVVRIGAIALELTGMPEEKAYFQALSAFAGVGFTTRESELAVANPERRRIMRILIRFGNAGIVTTVGTLAGTLVESPKLLHTLMSEKYAMFFGLNPTQLTLILIILFLTLIYQALKRPAISRLLNEVIATWLLREQFVSSIAFEEIVENAEGYGVMRIEVRERSPLVGRTFEDLEFDQKQIKVLSLESVDACDSYPPSTSLIQQGNVLILFGPLNVIKNTCLLRQAADATSLAVDSADAPLAIGTEAPEIVLKDQNGKIFSSRSLLGKKSIIVNFYPKDRSHFCSTVLQAFNENLQEIRRQGIEVVAINPESVDSHKDFCQMLNTDLPILSDPKKSVCRAYRALMVGGLLVNRSIYVIGKDGRIAYAKRGRPPVSEIISAARVV